MNTAATSVLKIAVLGSGRGSNFGAIQEAVRNGSLPGARVVLVVSNNPKAGILDRAREEEIPASCLSRSQFLSEALFVEKLLRLFREHDVNFVALAGYMKHLPVGIISAYRNRIVNIHPALLPKFGGKGMFGEHVHRAVLESGEKRSGASVHIVDEEYDHGPVILQQEVPVLSSDTAKSLADRVLAVEHELYPRAIRLFAEGRVVIENKEIVIHQD